MINVDLHIHTRFSPDSEVSPTDLVNRCVKVGLNCIAVTDHNTIEGALAVQKIADFQVIVGEEIGSASGEITGLFLKEKVPKRLSPIETVKRIKDQGGLVSIPHPFDRFRGEVISRSSLDEILPYVDIMEAFNSRNSFSIDDRKAEQFASKHGLLISGVSDSHTLMELGRTYVKMPEFDGTPDGFKLSLAQGTIVGQRTNPLIHILTTITKLKKRLTRTT